MDEQKKAARRFRRWELKQYLEFNPMTDEEREALEEWVKSGHGVHENAELCCYVDGGQMDFLDVYRKEKEVRETLASMTEEEGRQYLRETHGIDLDAAPHPFTYREVMEKAILFNRTETYYWEFLQKNHNNDLMREAQEYVKEHVDNPFQSDREYSGEADDEMDEETGMCVEAPLRPVPYREAVERTIVLNRRQFYYEDFLWQHGLAKEAEEYVKEHIERDDPFEPFFLLYV